jgi:integrase
MATFWAGTLENQLDLFKRMKVTYDKQRKRFKVIVPPKITGTGKREVSFWKDKKDAEAEIRARLDGTNKQKISADALALLQLVRTKYNDDFEAAFAALGQHSRMMAAIKKPGATLKETADAFIANHEETGKHRVTLSKYRSTLNRFCGLIGEALPIVEVTEEMIAETYLKQFKAGGTRKTQWSNLHAFFKWAVKKGYVSTHPLANAERLGPWKSKKGILAVEDFRRILFACADKYPRLLPYFVLGGLAGLRRCEMISNTRVENDPRIEWADIDFKASKIRIRHEVAKETLADDRKRMIPLEPAAAEWLQLVSKTQGPVMAISQSTLQRDKASLLDELGLKVSENALRNSYASYAASFRGLGDVSRAMGDLEQTIKRFYVDVGIDPELGRAWFDIRPTTGRKIVSMVAYLRAAVSF